MVTPTFAYVALMILCITRIQESEAIKCYTCAGLRNGTPCNVQTECWHTQVCGIEQEKDGTFYQSCKANSSCALLPAATGRCCNFDLCNDVLHEGLECYVCSGGTKANICRQTTKCWNTQLCSITLDKDGTVFQSCRDKAVCARLTADRGHCCDTDLCNTNITIPSKSGDHCQSSPCVHGSCTSNNHTFSCTCRRGYSGSKCDVRDHCQSSPCIHGSCTSNNHTFSCTCHRGYSGSKCDVKNPCSRHPCKNGGTCVSKHTSYTCHCAKGFTGRQCEEGLIHLTYVITIGRRGRDEDNPTTALGADACAGKACRDGGHCDTATGNCVDKDG